MRNPQNLVPAIKSQNCEPQYLVPAKISSLKVYTKQTYLLVFWQVQNRKIVLFPFHQFPNYNNRVRILDKLISLLHTSSKCFSLKMQKEWILLNENYFKTEFINCWALFKVFFKGNKLGPTLDFYISGTKTNLLFVKGAFGAVCFRQHWAGAGQPPTSILQCLR